MSDSRRQRIPVTPHQVSNPTYYVTLERADILVAKGLCKWEPGLRRLREVKQSARGEHRVWHKTMCYDPDTRVALPTMQLVNPDTIRAPYAGATINRSHNRKRPARLASTAK
ncbi:hypothetical protein KGP36_03230 [Patescibacteria group bacterium]|nr:hypothetical protein [Patescibacteria group bacterium]